MNRMNILTDDNRYGMGRYNSRLRKSISMKFFYTHPFQNPMIQTSTHTQWVSNGFKT